MLKDLANLNVVGGQEVEGVVRVAFDNLPPGHIVQPDHEIFEVDPLKGVGESHLDWLKGFEGPILGQHVALNPSRDVNKKDWGPRNQEGPEPEVL